MKQDEDRILDLMDELMDHPEEEFLSGKMVRAWAEKCLEHEAEERIAVLAFLKHALPSSPLVDMIERGTHRRRSTEVMRAIKKAQGGCVSDEIDRMVREYVGGNRR